LCFSGHGKRLFVNDPERQHVRVVDVNLDGTLTNSREWAKTTGDGAGAPDRMKLDADYRSPDITASTSLYRTRTRVPGLV